MIKKNSLTFLLLFIFLFSIAMAADEAMKSGASRMEMSDSKRYDPPLPVSLIGTKLDGQVNFMTCAWFTRVEIDPYMFGISIQKQHFTHKAIMENRCFSINIPVIDMIPQVNAVGMVSGKEYDKSKVFDVFYGDNENCPMVDGSIVTFECEVVNSVDLAEPDEAHPRAHTLFIGEVKNVWVNKNGVKDNGLDFETLNPIIWTLSPNSFWTLGENQGRAFNREYLKLVPKKQ